MPKFRLLQGKHSQKEMVVDENGRPVLDEDKKPRKVNVLYKAGEIIETDVDLIKLFPSAASLRYELISSGGERSARTVDGHKYSGGKVHLSHLPKADVDKLRDQLIKNTPEREKPDMSGTVQNAFDKPQKTNIYTEADLSGFSVPELKEIAASEEVDLKNASKKEEIIKLIVTAKGKK